MSCPIKEQRQRQWSAADTGRHPREGAMRTEDSLLSLSQFNHSLKHSSENSQGCSSTAACHWALVCAEHGTILSLSLRTLLFSEFRHIGLTMKINEQ